MATAATKMWLKQCHKLTTNHQKSKKFNGLDTWTTSTDGWGSQTLTTHIYAIDWNDKNIALIIFRFVKHIPPIYVIGMVKMVKI